MRFVQPLALQIFDTDGAFRIIVIKQDFCRECMQPYFQFAGMLFLDLAQKFARAEARFFEGGMRRVMNTARVQIGQPFIVRVAQTFEL